MLIIPNLKMPGGCDECPCCEEGYCSAIYFMTKEILSLPNEYAYSKTKRYPNCPLIESEEIRKKCLLQKISDAVHEMARMFRK